VGGAGGDEVGDVAAFRNLHVVTERLTGEILAMTAAIRENRLDHRADVGVVGGDGNFRRVNPAVERTLRCTAEELLSTPWGRPDPPGWPCTP